MPYRVSKTSKCAASKPWGVFLIADGSLVSCHTSKEKANAAVRAIYANEGKIQPEDRRMTATTERKQAIRRMVVPFQLKAAVDPASHTFEGLAAVIGVKDLGNDIIEPGAFLKTLAEWKASGDALPLLDSHNQYSIMGAFGQLISAKETKDGLQTQWEVIPGPEGDCIMARLTPSKVTGRPIVGKMSIGYIPVKWEIEQPEGTSSWYDQIRHLSEVELKECSLVLFPMAPGAAIDASTVKSFLLSAQATEAKSLDAVAKLELRKLATRIGVLLSKAAATLDASAPTLPEEEKGKKKPVEDTGASGMSEEEMVLAASDPALGVDDGDADADNHENPLETDDVELIDPATGKKKPKKPVVMDPMMSAEVAKAQPYVFQEALEHRLKTIMLKNKVSEIGQPK